MINTPYRYVLPIPKQLRGSLLEYNRLYAYPSIPESPAENGFVILDSGAFGLSMQGRSITKTYMAKLNEHYKQNISDNAFAVAPDVFLNPAKTIRNWKYWHSQDYIDVCPIIQFSEKGMIDLANIRYQVDVYKEHHQKFWLVSNPSICGNYALSSRNLQTVFEMCRNAGAEWIHILGAGWSIKDIQVWSLVSGFDSMDSIAYYTSVKQNEYWSNERENTNFVQQSIKHAEIANNTFLRY